MLCTLGCATDEPASGCGKDTDCREGRICEKRICVNATSGSGGSGSGGSGSADCVNAGESCGVNGDCCSFADDAGYCVSSTCADRCDNEGAPVHESCVSGCCAPLEAGGFACAPFSLCDNSCVPTGELCSVNGDCCNFLTGGGFCVSGYCSDACDPSQPPPGDCVSGCCAGLEAGDFACAPEYVCQ